MHQKLQTGDKIGNAILSLNWIVNLSYASRKVALPGKEDIEKVSKVIWMPPKDMSLKEQAFL